MRLGCAKPGSYRRGRRQRSHASSSEQGTSTLTSTAHQQPSAFGDVWGHAASACDAASVSRVHNQEDVKPDDHTVSACVSNDLPGVMLPVGLNKAVFQQRTQEAQSGRISGACAYRRRYARRCVSSRVGADPAVTQTASGDQALA